ncbi:MAG: hypothetical protein AAF127_16115 [Pseudomonadota bacterium]
MALRQGLPTKGRDVSDNQTSGRLPTGGKLDLNAVWARGISLLRENWQLFAIIAGVFVLLPNAFLQFALPSDAELDEPLNTLIDPAKSEAVREAAAQALGTLLAPFITFAGLVTVITHVGYACLVAMMGKRRPTVGEALLQAMKAILPLVLAMVLYFASVYLLIVVVQLALVSIGAAAGAFIGAIVCVLAIVFATARLSLTLPAIVLEGEMNPVKALMRSWRLTAASPGNVFGFWMLLCVAWFVSIVVLSLIGLAVMSIPGLGSAATLIEGLMGGAFSMIWGTLYCAMGVAMHRELSGPDPETLARQFD